MEITKNIQRTFDIKYVDCKFTLEDISKCKINNISSTAQTIKHLPFLKYELSGFKWDPRIILETGKVVCWPEGITAVVNFKLRYHTCVYLTSNYETAFEEVYKIPNYLQLDLIDDSETLSFTINSKGYIENWPKLENIIKELQ